MKNAASGRAFSDAPLQRAARHEAVAGSVHAAEAEELFRSEVNALLPRNSLPELGQLSVDDVEKWADKWNVFAPCIVRAARAFVMCASEHPDIMREYADLGGGRQGMHAHPQWAHQLARLDGLPPVPYPRRGSQTSYLSVRESTSCVPYKRSVRDSRSCVPFRSGLKESDTFSLSALTESDTCKLTCPMTVASF